MRCDAVQRRLHSRVKKQRRDGSGHVGQRTSRVEGGAKALEGQSGWTDVRENSKRELCRNVLGGSDVWNSLRDGIQKCGGDG